MAENNFTAGSTIPEELAKIGDIERPELIRIVDEYCIGMEAFFDLAIREIENHNNSDFDGIKFLTEAARSKLLDFSSDIYAKRTSAAPDENAVSHDDTTAADLARQSPCNAEPFAVWYSLDVASGRGCWAINDDAGIAVYETPSHEAAVKLSRALSPSSKCKGAVCDIWMVHAQTVAALAAVDCLDEIEGIDESEEFPAVRAMLRDMKAKLERLAGKMDSVALA